MTQGYRLQFFHKPALSTSCLQPAVRDKWHRKILEEEVATLLSKGTIREVEKANHEAGFFSHYFLSLKLNYLDNWLVCVQTQQMCRDHVSRLLHIKNLGPQINKKKSKLEPSQVTRFLGMTLDSRTASISLIAQRIELQAVSPCDGPDGSHCPVSPTQPFAHATSAAMSAEPEFQPPDSSVDQTLGDTTICLTRRLESCTCRPRCPSCLDQQTVEPT